jgi:hypothetical protein
VPTGAIRSSAGVDLGGSAGVDAETGATAGVEGGACVAGGWETAGDGALDRANEGCVVPVGRTNDDVGAVYGFGAGFAAEGVGAGAELYFEPEDSFIRLRMWSGVMSASFRAWMVRWEFFRNDEIWEAYVSVG